eukprot:jgi/Undpi1/529/HiC_scaffold_10.g03993.m1
MVFLSVVRDTVEEVSREVASEVLQKEAGRMESARRNGERTNGGSVRSHRRNGSGMEIPAPSTRPGLPHTGDSASGSVFDPNSPSRDYGGPRGIAISNGNVSKKVSAFANGGAYNNNNSNGYGNANGTYGNSNGSGSGNGTAAPAERRRRRSRKASMAQGEGASLAMSAAAVAVVEDDGAGRRDSGGRVKGGGGGGASKTDASDDEEREALLALLSEAYGQVNELTDELKMSLDKLHLAETELKKFSRSTSNSQLLPKTNTPSPADDESVPDAETKGAGGAGGDKTVSKMIKGMFPNDEGSRSTPANVRQLQVEVQRLRQRVTQANAKEEKHRADLWRVEVPGDKCHRTLRAARGLCDS